MMSENKMLSEISRLYYIDNQTQVEIAQRFGISRPKVSRLLAKAKEKGIVKIFIASQDDEMTEIEQKLFSAFHLKGLKVVSVPDYDRELAVKITARTGAEYLSSFLEDGDRIGVSWGWTLYEMTKNFPALPLKDTLVCQLTGSVDNAQTRSFANEIVTNLSSRIGALNAYSLPCPAMVDNPIILDTLLHDMKVKTLLESGKSCNKLFVNIALPDEESCLYQAGYLSGNDLENLKKNGAVGSVCCRFFDGDGKVCMADLDARTIGISVEDIKNAELVMACLVGEKKAKAVYCALQAGMIDVLVLDSITAARVAALIDEAQA